MPGSKGGGCQGARGRVPALNPAAAYRHVSLYARVVIVNATIIVAATLILSLTPAEVPFPDDLRDTSVIVLGILVATGANALLLRLAFASLVGLSGAMREIDLLRPGTRLLASGGAEVEQVILTFNEMLDRLEEERLDSNRRTHLAREAERRRIGQELHDEIGQRLTGILLELRRTLDHDWPPATRTELEHTQELTRETLDEVGRIAWQMRPGILDDLGISRALEALVDGVTETAPAAVSLDVSAALPECGPDVEIVLYRVAQEALTNALRHAEADSIRLKLEPRPTGGLSLQIIDDGNGLDADGFEGAGLRGMRERALSIGAELSIDSVPGAGVTVRLVVDDTGLGE
jgi:two-component system, NarL family, sensor histidine kinase UhpB